MASGIQVTEECGSTFEDMKIKHKYGFVIFKISGDHKQIVVESTGEKGASYDSFCELMVAAGNNKEGRFAVVDCTYDPAKSSKLVFITWLPDDKLGIKQKMIYSSSKKALREKLNGVAKDIQCNDLDDLAWSNIVEKCQSKYD